jgi:hypothetical protein
MVLILDDDDLGREWVNSPKTYPIQSFGVLRDLEDGFLDLGEKKYRQMGLLVESKNAIVMVIFYKTSLDKDFFKCIINPGERRWVLFPGAWNVHVTKLNKSSNDGALIVKYDLWAEV